MCSSIGLLASGIIGFGLVAGERPQPGALTAGEDHGLHRVTSRAGDRRAASRPLGLRAARCRASGTYVDGGVVAEHEAGDREEPREHASTTSCAAPWCDRPTRNSGKREHQRERARLARPTARRCGARPAAASASTATLTTTSRDEDEDPDHERHAAVDQQRDAPPTSSRTGRRPGRGPCRGRCPGRSGGRSSRRPSRWRRGRRAATAAATARRRRRAATRTAARTASRTSEITFGTVTIAPHRRVAISVNA